MSCSLVSVESRSRSRIPCLVLEKGSEVMERAREREKEKGRDTMVIRVNRSSNSIWKQSNRQQADGQADGQDRLRTMTKTKATRKRERKGSQRQTQTHRHTDIQTHRQETDIYDS